MSRASDWTFRIERTSYKSADLIYEEPGHRLAVYLEMSGVKQFDWVGCDTGLAAWTQPAREPIPPHTRALILERLEEWCRERSVRIDIGPPMDMEAMFSAMEKAGSRVERRPDGTVVVSRPAARGLLARALASARRLVRG